MKSLEKLYLDSKFRNRNSLTHSIKLFEESIKTKESPNEQKKIEETIKQKDFEQILKKEEKVKVCKNHSERSYESDPNQ